MTVDNTRQQKALEMRPFEESLPMALLRGREAAMQRFRPILAEHDLTEQQWRTLRALSSTEAPIDVGQVAEATFLLGPSLSRILTNLDDRGLVTRSTDPTDQRRTLVSLTAAGIELVLKIAPRSEAEYCEVERLLGSTRLRELLSLLDDLAATSPKHQERSESRPS